MNVSSLTPIDSSKSIPRRRKMSMSCGCVLRPAPRPVRSSALRSKTTASQPTLRRRRAANSPPSEPPITRARRAAMTGLAMPGSCHGPRDAVVAWLVIAVALRRVAVDERPAIKRVSLAAYLVLYGEQDLARIEIDDVLEAIFVIVDLGGEKAELFEPPIGTREIRDIDLRVVTVIGLLGLVGLAEVPVLLLARLHAGLVDTCALDHGRERTHDLAIETRDAVHRAGTDVERDIGHPQHDAAEAGLVRRMNVDAVAPGADRLHAVVAFAEVEFRSFQRLAHLRQTLQQRRTIRHDQAGDAAQHVGLPSRQMELAHPDIDPHVAGAGVEKGIAREAETGDVVVRRQVLVADADIDVPEIDDVAEILGRAIVLLVCHGVIPLPRGILSRSGSCSQRLVARPRRGSRDKPIAVEEAARLEVTSIVRSATGRSS